MSGRASHVWGVHCPNVSPIWPQEVTLCGSHHHQGVALLYCVLTLLKTHSTVQWGKEKQTSTYSQVTLLGKPACKTRVKIAQRVN